MKNGYIIYNPPLFANPNFIIVSNYVGDNEVVNWTAEEKPEPTRSDVGMWRIKYKSHVKAA